MSLLRLPKIPLLYLCGWKLHTLDYLDTRVVLFCLRLFALLYEANSADWPEVVDSEIKTEFLS